MKSFKNTETSARGFAQRQRGGFNFHDLSFEHTVPKALVHKRLENDVLVTDVRESGQDTFLCGGVVPTAHSFFNERGREPTRDILFYTEMGRQASIAVSHRFFNVPMEHCFIMGGSNIELLAERQRQEKDLGVDRIAIEIRVLEKQLRKGTLTTAHAEYALFSERCQVIRGTGSWSPQPKSLFERVRRSTLANLSTVGEPVELRTVEPEALGRGDASNVVISCPEEVEGRRFSAYLQVNLEHPFFFDHPFDHIPAILGFEGCAQLAMLSITRATGFPVEDLLLDGCEIRFDHFVELSLQTQLEAHIELLQWTKRGCGTATVVVAVNQSGFSLGRALLHATLYSKMA